MKKAFYILAFAFFGFELQLVLHAIFERLHLTLLLQDFDKYSMGYSLKQLFTLHYQASIVFIVIGVLLGLWQGFYWWKRIYTPKS